MARVPYVTRETMTPDGQQVWDGIERSRGEVAGNFRALLNSPQAVGKMAELGGYVRFETPLDRRVKALVILTTAREANGHYVWTVNQREAREAGLSDEVIEAIDQRRAPVGLESKDARVVQFVLELLRHHRISEATFEALRAEVGDAGIIDVLLVSGYYHTLAHCLQALEVELPEGVTSVLSY
jgi:4-carboxymuconolactone decarboxylase